MRTINFRACLVSFFCLCGWVCSGPAIGADLFQATESAATPAEPMVQVTLRRLEYVERHIARTAHGIGHVILLQV